MVAFVNSVVSVRTGASARVGGGARPACAAVGSVKRCVRARTVRIRMQQKEEDDAAVKLEVGEEDPEKKRKREEAERLRAAEKFIEIDQGDMECMSCGYVYERKKGEPSKGIPAGTPFDAIPDTFECPGCRSEKSSFKSIKKVIAGFAENQSYGFGSNTWTGDQKTSFIFGGLAIFFLLFLSGYLLE
ncbi:Rubredoxin [Porphyridium purpureum]|uniref:Rubredoxin n=1 Tax=Porphyridium purpureum TaxID=35688 RepID=A0A5J4Z9L5_PORPP|nr:Rubredoxin [Porphyridium purpureum]|eukprot:POR3244..scf295_1